MPNKTTAKKHGLFQHIPFTFPALFKYSLIKVTASCMELVNFKNSEVILEVNLKFFTEFSTIKAEKKLKTISTHAESTGQQYVT